MLFYSILVGLLASAINYRLLYNNGFTSITYFILGFLGFTSITFMISKLFI